MAASGPPVSAVATSLRRRAFGSLRVIATLSHRKQILFAMAASSSSSSSEAAPTGPADGIRRDRILSSKLYFDVPPSKVAVLRSLSSLRYSSIFRCRFM
ncbi:hypothetical protein BHE74_00013532 [Ensete ventricosum]|nr:hypothetical protein BHE74_00013532 [Ensete ventricosum]